MAKWSFNCIDNGGKKQFFTVSAPDKITAIKKGMERAKKHASGDISPTWTCKLIKA